MQKNDAKKISAYDKIRDIIINRLEQAKKDAEDGGGEEFHWIKSWSGTGLVFNQSYATREIYKGINQVLLSCAVHGADEWLTFPAIKKYQENDSKVKLRKGAKGQNVIYYDHYIKKDKDGNPVDVDDDGNPIPRYFVKTYYVFSVEDVEGLERHADKVKRYEHSASVDINRLESILSYYFKAAGIELEAVDGGNRAFYSLTDNIIRIPDKSNFKSVVSYAHTMTHEAIHSTGRKLGRDIANSFGSKAYSAEELVADIGADFLTNRLHIIADSPEDEELENSIAYINGWLDALKLEDTKLNICKAAADAQKAADYIYDTAIQMMKDEMIASTEAVMQFESGVYLRISKVGNDLYEYSFYEADGTYIDSGTIDEAADIQNVYDAANEAIKDYELSIEDGWLLPTDAFNEMLLSVDKSEVSL